MKLFQWKNKSWMLFFVLCFLMLTSCTKKPTQSVETTLEGTYSYEQYNTNYGVKLEVKVKDNKITSVKVLTSDLVEASPTSVWPNASVWETGKTSFYQSFVGKTVSEVLAIKVDVDSVGVPTKVTDFAVVTGATLSSGRGILAVQNALKKIK